MLTGLRAETELNDLIAETKAKIDCQKLVPDPDNTREPFERYVRQRCINPEHTDTNPTLLVFPDGANCSACGWRGDAIDIYRLYNPESTIRQACQALLAQEDLTLEGGIDQTPKVRRVLDPDTAIRNHLFLVENPKELAALVEYGISLAAIKHFRLGLANTLIRIKEEEVEGAENVEWRTIKDKQIPYQWQRRFAVPVYSGTQLKQVLYRKLDNSQLGSKISMERDCGPQLFGVDELKRADRVLVVEGWSDKIIAWEYGVAAVTSTNGAGHWHSEWNELVSNARQLYVVADADDAGKKMVERLRKDFPWARPLELPWEQGTKQDIRDLKLAGWQKEDFLKLFKKADIAASWRVFTKGV